MTDDAARYETAADIERLLNENGYTASIMSTSSDTLEYASGGRQTTALNLTIKVHLDD